ncbi:MAG: hypothetical protein QOE30_3558 [Mycobacterium sp.]|nr:hypothetical protein [Mycobacterium sp.]MDT5117819.1 hypothetical protein [Mycobacterium sp.]
MRQNRFDNDNDDEEFADPWRFQRELDPWRELYTQMGWPTQAEVPE